MPKNVTKKNEKKLIKFLNIENGVNLKPGKKAARKSGK